MEKAPPTFNLMAYTLYNTLQRLSDGIMLLQSPPFWIRENMGKTGNIYHDENEPSSNEQRQQQKTLSYTIRTQRFTVPFKHPALALQKQNKKPRIGSLVTCQDGAGSSVFTCSSSALAPPPSCGYCPPGCLLSVGNSISNQIKTAGREPCVRPIHLIGSALSQRSYLGGYL